ncbi:phosphohistidine phosphatase [Pontibacter aydingkolensis]|uniref:Histidine phosphatase family protein n=1 Tax=Pontibacter aydingkolensis TaxID=1911536 RepID=A0ABS7CXN8_9BACT|nr:histidine phosphatase family protein [Pontibacter aydingkolensis]MBW7468609.1 histidine phosphatase family protein [Pontibacter aydingkolensis]
MQRKILICRHGESEDPYPLQPDFERKLTPFGTQQVKDTGVWLRENFAKVDKILSSPAKRTSQTTRIIAAKLYFEEERVDYLPDLYNAKEYELLKCLAALPDNARTVLLVGHNPGVTRLVRELTDKMVGYLDTAQAVSITIDLKSWEEIHFTTGTLSNNTAQQV